MAKKSQSAKAAGGVGEPRSLATPLAWGVMAVAWLLIAAALASYDAADWPGHAVAPYPVHPHNWVGNFGAFLAYQLYLMAGPGIWVLMLAWIGLVVATAMRRTVGQLWLRIIGVVLMTVAFSALVGVALPNWSTQPEGAGGLIAIAINTELGQRFSTFGTLLLLLLIFWVGAILTMDTLVMSLANGLGRLVVASSRFRLLEHLPRLPKIHIPMPWHGRTPALAGMAGAGSGASNSNSGATVMQRNAGATVAGDRVKLRPDVKRDKPAPAKSDAIEETPTTTAVATPNANDDSHPGEGFETLGKVIQETSEEEPSAPLADADAEEADANPQAMSDAMGDEDGPLGDAPGAYVAEKNAKAFDPDALRAKIKAMPINFAPGSRNGKNASGGGGDPLPKEIDLSGYQFPGMDLLLEPEANFTAEMEKIVRDQAIQLESALQQYRIEGEVVGIDSGPVITLFEVRLKPGTKVSALGTVSSDLARALKAHNIRIVPNTAGKDTVGIEVPNIKKERVRLKELMTVNDESRPTNTKMKLPMYLGKDASGTPLIADLVEMPHMLIAGTTGSGKSVCMNSIIMSFLFAKRPDELKLVLVDPKMVELSMFKDIPHLMCPVVTEMAKAAAILEWATTKMDERYELLAEAGVRDIGGYNNLSWEELKERFAPSNENEEARIPKKLPYMVFIIDELADLMITNKEVEGFIVRLAQKARAVGLHLILATQRPQANVVTGLIKGNMPCRISFKVASGLDSRIVLDQKGAELLLGQGDMLYLSPRTSKLTRAQGTLVDDGEIRKCVHFLKNVAEQNFEPQLVQIRSANAGDVDEEAAKDPLFDEAVRVVLQTKRGSVSLLQRRLTIGYARSSRLIEAMYASGILGEYKGSQAREVTITIEEWEAMRAQAEKDAAAAAAANPGGSDSNASGQPAPEGEGMFDDETDDDDDDTVPDEMDGEFRA